MSQVLFGQVQIGGRQVLLQVTSGGRAGDEEDVRRAVQQPRRRDLAVGRARLIADHGAHVRVSAHDVNETIVLDGRVAILAGDESHGARSYSVITQPEVVHGITSLFEAAWRAGAELAVHEAEMAELRAFAPGVLDALNAGWTDETAARALGVSLRTYRRLVAELMTALGASSRFQAGARPRELGLV